MPKIFRTIVVILFALGVALSLCFLICNLDGIVQLACFAALAVATLAFVLLNRFAPRFAKKSGAVLRRCIRARYFPAACLAVVLVLGTTARIVLSIKFPYVPVSDPKTFYDAATSIANGTGIAGNSYVAFFPYVAAYDNLLAFAMKIIPDARLAVTALNTFFDISAACVTYLLTAALAKKSVAAPLAAFALWFLSPFNIIFSVISLPIVIVNFFIIAVIFAAYFLRKNILQTKVSGTIMCAIYFAILAGIGNLFRPVFGVMIIALVIFLAFLIYADRNNRRLRFSLTVGAVAIVGVLFFGIQSIGVHAVSSQTGIATPNNSGGWSIFVGANRASRGQWNVEDANYRDQIVQTAVGDLNSAHQRLQHEGIERYKSYGFLGSVDLLVDKFFVFITNQGKMYNANNSLLGYRESATATFINACIALYAILLFSASALFLYYEARRVARPSSRGVPFALLMVIVVLGLSFSALFVEAAARYAQVLYPMFIVFSALALRDIYAGRSASRILQR